MFCSKCGKENNNGNKFCKFCGERIDYNQPLPENQKNKGIKKKSFFEYGARIAISIVSFVVAYFAVNYFFFDDERKLADSKQDLINDTVQQIKNEAQFPNEVDSVTTWIDIVAVSGAIRYVYVLHDADLSQVSNESLKKNIVTGACQDNDIKNNLLDQGINMEFSYSVKTSDQTFFTSVSQDDCN